jgi:hypothetical protein
MREHAELLNAAQGLRRVVPKIDAGDGASSTGRIVRHGDRREAA